MAYVYNREAIAKYLRSQGSPMRVEDFEGFGVNPAALAAFAAKESQGGTTGYARQGTFNPYGWGIHQGRKFSSWREASAAVAKGLNSSLYKGAGLRTPSQILPRYAPSSENDTPLYIKQMADLRRQFGDPNPEGDIFGPGGGGPAPKVSSPTGTTSAKPAAAGFDLGGAAMAALNRPEGQSLTRAIGQQFMASKLAAAPGQTDPAPALAEGARQLGAPAKATNKAEQAIKFGEEVLGTPYSWGGGGPGGPGRGFAQGANTVGFDCSSLMQYMTSKVGVSIPRTTYGQIKAGQGVNARNRAAWRPGDLLFPSTGHVQMYVGDGKVIEAPRTGGHVQVVPARSSYIAVRRVM